MTLRSADRVAVPVGAVCCILGTLLLDLHVSHWRRCILVPVEMQGGCPRAEWGRVSTKALQVYFYRDWGILVHATCKASSGDR